MGEEDEDINERDPRCIKRKELLASGCQKRLNAPQVALVTTVH